MLCIFEKDKIIIIVVIIKYLYKDIFIKFKLKNKNNLMNLYYR